MKTKVRQARIEDVFKIIRLDNIVWPNFPADEKMIRSRIETFPEGQLVAEINGTIVGAVFTQRINYQEWINKNFTWEEVTDRGTIRRTHNPKGKVLYGVGMSVLPQFRNKGIAMALMVGVAKMAFKNGLNTLYLGAPLTDYKYHPDLSPEEYLERNEDPEIEFYKKRGFQVLKILPDYMEGDPLQKVNVLMKIEVLRFFTKIPTPLRKIVGVIIAAIPTSFLKKLLGG